MPGLLLMEGGETRVVGNQAPHHDPTGDGLGL